MIAGLEEKTYVVDAISRLVTSGDACDAVDLLLEQAER